MKKIFLEITSDRPIDLNLNSFKAQGALMIAHMGGYIDKGSIQYDPVNSTLKLTVRDKAIKLAEEHLK